MPPPFTGSITNTTSMMACKEAGFCVSWEMLRNLRLPWERLNMSTFEFDFKSSTSVL
jgi:hypothetical protein